MSREWQPGDVAHIDVADGGAVGIWTGEFWAWSDGNGPFEGVSHCHRDVPARPLVVIDPEDRRQIQRLVAALTQRESHDGESLARQMQAALRSLAAPPKPDEPTGLGAVVEDESQVEFIHLGSGLWVYGTTDGPSKGFTYADIAAVRVLSEGVPA